eukprot:CAMPEP_0183712704 /NCGR_PEP_ID=MMETSP0737-20130205/7773_1 /TAXON_ID=385413 /ORGANISM="Thalassiosira miniscula, Strain CCMP1093" /LENGTH=857 /DNA_ID=CAMNT_0025941373 /DNA_START=59 /DNA_END=2629 /DNA_ORIENTATION=-
MATIPVPTLPPINCDQYRLQPDPAIADDGSTSEPVALAPWHICEESEAAGLKALECTEIIAADGSKAHDECQADYMPSERGMYYAVRVGYASPVLVSDDEDDDVDIHPTKKRKRGDGQSWQGSPALPPVTKIRSAIFLYWQDARQFVDEVSLSPEHKAEYSAFNSFLEAETYLLEDQKRLAMVKARSADWEIVRAELKGKRSPAINAVPKKSPPLVDLSGNHSEGSNGDCAGQSIPIVNTPGSRREIPPPVPRPARARGQPVAVPNNIQTRGSVNNFAEKYAPEEEAETGAEWDGVNKYIYPPILPTTGEITPQARLKIRRDTPWDKMYHKMLDYQQDNPELKDVDTLHGWCNAPEEEQGEHPEIEELRRWCNLQLRCHRRWAQGHTWKNQWRWSEGIDSSKLILEKIGKLQGLGLVTASYDELYERLANIKAETGSLDVKEDEDEELYAWTREQKNMLWKHKKGKDVPLSEERIRNLKSLGLESKGLLITNYRDDTPWDKMYNKMLDFKNNNPEMKDDLDAVRRWCNITDKAEESFEMEELRRWCNSQLKLLRRWGQGHPWKNQYKWSDRDTSKKRVLEKVAKLRRLGLLTASYDELYEKLANIKAETGSLDVKEDEDEELYAWIREQKDMLWKHSQGRPVPLSDEQIENLKSLGFDCKGNQVAKINKEKKWNRKFEALKKYMEDHGSASHPTDIQSLPKPERSVVYFIKDIRRQYKALKQGKESTLTAQHLQRLTEIGFDFCPRGDNTPWEVRIQHLRDFVAEHGHCKPGRDNSLGKFVSNIRTFYRERENGKKNCLTDERVNDLIEIGFVFKAGKTPVVTEKKTWEERFEDLLAYKEEHGHTQVPQRLSSLGNW